MGVLKRLDETSVSGNRSADEDRLLLYEKYGAMAYGVILQILPETQLAQQILVDLFASPQIDQCIKSPTSPGCNIIRLARSKALAARQAETDKTLAISESESTDPANRAKLAFDLSFRKGYALGAVAEKLQIPYTDVMESIRDYFKYLRTS